MSLDEIIKEAIKPLVPVCVIDVYGGKAEEFCVYTYTEEPVYYGMMSRIHPIPCAAALDLPWRPGITATPEIKAKEKADQAGAGRCGPGLSYGQFGGG